MQDHAAISASPEQAAMQRLAIDWTVAQPVVASFLTGMVPNHHDAEDILQRTAAALVVKYADYDPAQPFVGWAIGLARIEVLRYRQERSRERATFDTDTVEALSAAFTEMAPVISDMRAALDRCIAKLNGRVREVFELHYLQELSPTAIGQRVNRSAASVFVALHRGREAVRECMRRQLQAGGGA